MKRLNGFIACVLSVIAAVTSAAVFGYCVLNASADARTSENTAFAAPADLAALQAADPDDIAALEKYDSRDYGIVTSVKNQGSEGLCWSYAALAAMETNILRKGFTTKDNIDLDEVSFAQLAFGEDYNNGGSGSYAGGIISHWYGMNVEGTRLSNGGKSNSGYIMTNMAYIHNSTASIKKAVAAYGAVSIDFYSGGISSGTKYYYTRSTLVNHSALIVGWDDTVSKNNFGSGIPAEDGAFIVKNSWGTDFGENGYHYFSYKTLLRGGMVFECEKASEYDRNYYQDTVTGGDEQLGAVYDGPKNEPIQTAGSVFQVENPREGATQVLKAVNFAADYLNYTDTVCTIKVYTDVNPSANDPTAGILRSTTVYNPAYTGYHTAILDEPITLNTDGYFSVVITTNSQLYTDKYSEREIPASYYYNGSEWAVDTDSNGRYSAMRLKAWTCDVQTNYDCLKTDLSGATLTLSESEFTYNGLDRCPAVTVTCGEKTLELNKEYTVEYFNNVRPGTATAAVSGQGYYKGTARTAFTIKKAEKPFNAPEEGSTILLTTDHVIYNVLPDGWRYESASSYTGALRQVGSTVEAVMNYTGSDAADFETVSVKVTLKRVQASTATAISKCSITVSNVTYTGMAVKPDVSAEYNGATLTEGTDFFVQYQNFAEAQSRACVIVWGIGSFYNYTVKYYDVEKAVAPAPQSNVTVEWNTDLNKVNWGSGWSLKDSGTAVPAGTSESVALIYRDSNNFSNTEAAATVTRLSAPTIEVKSLTDCVIQLDQTNFDYTGSVVKPKVTVTDSGYTLQNGIDYVLWYENNVRGGTAKVTVEGIVNYKDSRVYTYTINAPACYHDGEFSSEIIRATCTSNGYTVYTCASCGEYSYQADGVWALGHSYSRNYTFDASGHWYACTRCGDKKDFAAHSSGGAATSSADEICTVCGYIIEPATGHTHSLTPYTAKAATCTENGHTAYWHCSDCGKYFDDASATTQISQSSTIIAATGHSSSAEWYGNADGHWHVCDKCSEVLSISAHTAGAAATETAAQKCTVCEYVIQPALGHRHSLAFVDAKAATCTENGHSAYYVCGSCGKLYTDADAAQETDIDAVTVQKSAHAYIDGVCTACGDKNSEYQPPLSEIHVCGHVCGTCGKCSDNNCEDEACTDKCRGHVEPQPPAIDEHTCGHVCSICGKCSDNSCADEVCADKCRGHVEPQPPAIDEHTCGHVCGTCGKCLDNSCEDEVCADKCRGHSAANKTNKSDKTNNAPIAIAAIAAVGVTVAAAVTAYIAIKRRKR